MSYLVLARKWRPQDFEAITGQEHVTRTLTNAIEQDRVHHAFLFCGARGVGKTTAARVFARALNCAQGPTGNPCGQCDACVEIAKGRAVDVLEIDGASNRGIGEIRELREGIAYAPQRDRYKIYIIDEVHMLTTEAFNALLKTLEEPPSHVKFIFATTEPQKIPVTILSRCQRFDFKRIPQQVMVARLAEILSAEGITIAEGGLRLVARESEGSMRDALSLLDRIISFCGAEASYEQVAEVLGAADRTWLRDLVGAMLRRDGPEALAIVQGVFEFGTDLKQFTNDLVHYLRDIIVLGVAGEAGGALTDLADEERAVLMEIARAHAPEDLQRLLNVAVRTAERLTQASFPRLELEMAVVRMCQLRPLQPIDRLLARLEAIERHLESGAPLPPPGPGPSGGGGGGMTRSAHAPSQPSHTATPAPTARAAPAAPATPRMVSAAAATAVALAPEPQPQPAAMAAHETKPEAVAAPEAKPEAVAAHEAKPEAVAAPEAKPETEVGAEPEPQPAAEAPAQRAEDATGAPPPSPASPADAGRWEAFVDRVREAAPKLAGTLDHGQLLSVADGCLRVGFARGLKAQRATDQLADLRKALATHGPEVGLTAATVEVEAIDRAETSPYQLRQRRHQDKLEERRRTVEDHPTVKQVIERFGGTLTHINVFDEE